MSHGRVILLHSAFGLTEGIGEFAELLAAEGCLVETPDYYRGLTFHTVAEAVAHRDGVGYRHLFACVADLDVEGAALVGFSLGASFAQRLCVPGVRLVSLIGNLDPWRPHDPWCGVDVQLHQFRDDPWIDAADVPSFRAAVETSGAMFDHFVSPGEGHLFTEHCQPEYDRELTERTIDRIAAALP